MKWHQINLQTSKIIPRRDRAPMQNILDPPMDNVSTLPNIWIYQEP